MNPIIEKIKAKINLKLVFGILALFLVLAALGKVVTSKPFLEPVGLQITNITPTSVSISWTTEAAINEKVIFWEGEKFVFIPMGIPSKEDDKKDIQPTGQMLTHYVTLNDLEANMTYKFRIYSGFVNVYDGQFTTANEVLNQPPHPIYGKIVDSANKPIPAALVYFQIRTGVEYSAVLSTYTDLQGGWSLDLNQLKHQPNNLSQETLLINTGTTQKVSHSTIDFDEPWPTIVLDAR